ncbi:MAG: hypothetical protein JF619_07785 [Massilia sp.]|nr:hypothetical protein [Massilia sp.]
MNPSVQEAAQRLREAIREATRNLIDRDQLAELMVLGAVAQEHLLIVGPPGTDKSGCRKPTSPSSTKSSWARRPS